eukprot:scaffold1326_cov296-Prasinococcus_capsulatus_cf.AAC.2
MPCRCARARRSLRRSTRRASSRARPPRPPLPSVPRRGCSPAVTSKGHPPPSPAPLAPRGGRYRHHRAAPPRRRCVRRPQQARGCPRRGRGGAAVVRPLRVTTAPCASKMVPSRPSSVLGRRHARPRAACAGPAEVGKPACAPPHRADVASCSAASARLRCELTPHAVGTAHLTRALRVRLRPARLASRLARTRWGSDAPGPGTSS